MGWIKTDWDFGHPYRVFTINVREIACATLRDGIKFARDDPAEVEKVVLDLIRFYRPNLEGSAVVSLTLTGFMWHIGLMHRSFPRLKMGDAEESEPLVPQERARDGVFIHDEPMTDPDEPTISRMG